MDRKPFFQMLNNRHSAWIASEMILQQLEDVIEENKESYQTLLETLKEDYTLRAEIVANLLEMEDRTKSTLSIRAAVSLQEQIRSILATAFLPASKWDILSPCWQIKSFPCVRIWCRILQKGK